MYESGTKLKFTSEAKVTQQYSFQHGEYLHIVGQKLEAGLSSIQLMPTEKQVAEQFAAEYRKQGAKVIYLKCHLETSNLPVGHGYGEEKYKVTLVVDEFICQSQSPVAIVIVIALLILGVTVTFFVLFPGVIYKAAGVSPASAFGYAIAQIGPLIALGALLALVIAGIALMKGVVFRKNKTGEVSVGQEGGRRY